MVDTVEPMSWILWAIVAFAASMYPVGFMLGGSCSQCCGSGSCDDVFEFDRCVRFVNVDTSPPPTTYSSDQAVSEPLHGFSVPIKRPEDIGARRVTTKYRISGSVAIAQEAESMSDGESRSATYSITYNQGAANLGTAYTWNVTLHGVTRPLIAPPPQSRQVVMQQSGFTGQPVFTISNLPISQVFQYLVGTTTQSASAPLSGTVVGVRVSGATNYLDGSYTTYGSLKAMLSCEMVTGVGNKGIAIRYSFSPTYEHFKYVPSGSAIELEYVIAIGRGDTRRHMVVSLSLLSTLPASLVVATPAGGLPAFQPETFSYSDTAHPLRQSVFDGNAATLFSDSAGSVVGLPSRELEPSGAQLNNVGLYLTATNGEYLSPSFGSAWPRGGIAAESVAYGWIMRPFDPGGGYQFNSQQHPAANAWIYDTELVWSFLNGDSTVPCDIAGTIRNSQQRGSFGIDAPSTAFTVQISQPTQFCGASVCDYGPSLENWDSVYSDAIEKVVTCKLAPLPATYASYNDKTGTSETLPNLCHGKDDIPEILMLLSGGRTYFAYEYRCTYAGHVRSCQSPLGGSAVGSPQLYQASLSTRTFYCGDLLWAIENGPCRSVLRKTRFSGWGEDVFTLGGSLEASPYSAAGCGNGPRDALNEKCFAAEVELEVSGVQPIPPAPLGGSIHALTGLCWPCGQIGLSSGGVYEPAPYMNGTWVLSGGSSNCNQLYYSQSFQTPGGTVFAGAGLGRVKWCDAWDPSLFGASIRIGLLGLDNNNGYLGIVARHYGVVPDPQFPDLWWCDVASGYCPPLNLPRTAMTGGISGGGGGWINAMYQAECSVSGLGISNVDPTPPTVTPQFATLPYEGGSIDLTFCCPQQVQTFTRGNSGKKYPTTFIQWANSSTDQSAVAYITQAGYDGEECPFSVIWLAGVGGGVSAWSLGGSIEGRIFAPGRCPIEAQISHAEQPPCDWSVSSAESWLIAEKTESALLRLSIDWNQPATYSGSLPGYFKPYRSAVITISSGGTVQQWAIIEIKS